MSANGTRSLGLGLLETRKLGTSHGHSESNKPGTGMRTPVANLQIGVGGGIGAVGSIGPIASSSPLQSLAPQGTSLLPALQVKRSALSSSYSGAPSDGSDARLGHLLSSTRSSVDSDGKRSRLLQTLLVEKGKDTLVAKLKRKFITPDMPKDLQDSIAVVLDELSFLQNIHMSDVDRASKKIKTIKKEYYAKVLGSMEENAPAPAESEVIEQTNIENQKFYDEESKSFVPQEKPGIGVCLPHLVSQGSRSSRGSSSSGSYIHPKLGFQDEWGALMNANLQIQYQEAALAHDREKQQQHIMRHEWDKQIHSRRQRIEEEKDMEQQRYIESTDIMRQSGNQEDFEDQLELMKKLQEREYRLQEINQSMSHKNQLRQAQLDEQRRELQELKEDMEYQRDVILRDLHQKHENVSQAVREIEQKRHQKREMILQGIVNDKTDLERSLQTFDYKQQLIEEQKSRRKAERMARATAVKAPFDKSFNEKAYEDELRAAREKEAYEERLREEEEEKLRKIMKDREALEKSIRDIQMHRESIKKKEMVENMQLAERWKKEAQEAHRSDRMRLSEQAQYSQEIARQLQEQMKMDSLRRKMESTTMSDAERKLNQHILERAATISMASERQSTHSSNH